jgi:hypothetical protein
MEIVTVKEVFIGIAERALSIQAKNGAMPAGHNGPYFDPETPVRNTGHWLISFIRAFELCGDVRFENAARLCADFLLDAESPYRDNHTFELRQKKGKDKSNGTIGPAWTIEALVAAGRHFSDDRCIQLALEIFECLPFCEKRSLWFRREPSGEILSIDGTLNHQLWFAACSAPLIEEGSSIARERIESFENSLSQHMAVWPSGRIIHFVARPRTLLRDGLRRVSNSTKRRMAMLKEVGYHAFNMHAFALMKEAGRELPLFSTKRFERALGYMDSSEYLENIELTEYSFAYNPPGFEIPYTTSVFRPKDSKSHLTRWLPRQFERTLNVQDFDLSLNTSDPITLTARLSEMARFGEALFLERIFVNNTLELEQAAVEQ